MVPKRLTAIKKPQTRDLRLKIRGVQYDARRTELMPAVARLGVPLAARDQGAKCARSTGADRRKSATAEGTMRTISFDPYKDRGRIVL